MKSLSATASGLALLLAAASHAAAGPGKDVKVTTTGTVKASPPSYVRDHRAGK